MGTRRAATAAYSGPAMITAGTAMIRPMARVMPTLACTFAIATSGPGCGGTKPCRTDRPARAGIARYIAGSLDRRIVSMMTGISSTRPISKNIGMPMMKAISAIRHGKPWRAPVRILSTISSAPPESASSLPSIAPRTISTPTPPSTSPTPFSNERATLPSPMPDPIPTNRDPMVRARKPCTFAATISSTTMAIPIAATTRVWVS